MALVKFVWSVQWVVMVTVNQEIFGSVKVLVPPEYFISVAINFRYVECLKLLCGCTEYLDSTW